LEGETRKHIVERGKTVNHEETRRLNREKNTTECSNKETRIHLRDRYSPLRIHFFRRTKTNLHYYPPRCFLALSSFAPRQNHRRTKRGRNQKHKKKKIYNIPFGVSNTNLISECLVNGTASWGSLSNFCIPIACCCCCFLFLPSL
jgi:hypothetical protein